MKLFGAVFLALFSLYCTCSYSAFPLNDSPEIINAAVNLIPCHPPGYPLYTMLAKAFTFMPVAGVAMRVNFLSAFLYAITFALIFSFIRKRAGILIALCISLSAALSYIPWSLALEAKGGIYGLNLLLSALVFGLSLNNDAKSKYAVFFLLGLALADHWQSAVFLLPAIAVGADKYSLKQLPLCSLLFLAGLSPYLMVLIREGINMPFSWGSMNSFSDLAAYIMRKNYQIHAALSFDIIISNSKRFVSSVLFAGSLLLIPSTVGWIKGFKYDAMLFIKAAVYFCCLGTAVVFFNATPVSMAEYNDIFLMPAFIIMCLMAGIAAAVYKGKTPGIILTGLIAVSSCTLFVMNLPKCLKDRDFSAYDMAVNLEKTIKPESVLFSSDDTFAMASYYLTGVKGAGFRHYAAADLGYDFGAEYFRKDQNCALEISDLSSAIDCAAKNARVYLSPASASMMRNYPLEKISPSGMLYEYGAYKGSMIFDMYSYRSAFAGNAEASVWYPALMLVSAGFEERAGNRARAVILLERSLAFTHNMNREDIKRKILRLKHEG